MEYISDGEPMDDEELYASPVSTFEQTCSPEDKVFMSLDLNEATYNMPHELLEAQLPVLDKLMKDFPVWQCFRELFVCFEREIDMTNIIEEGYWEGPETVMTKTGSFMGDVMSFIHLSILLRTSVITAEGGGKRAIGQSVGDDLILMAVKFRLAERLKVILSALAAKFSKINSISKDAMTFCEQNACRIIDLEELRSSIPKESIFGDLVLLDNVKGSLLSGKSKVKSNGSTPFFGHASMLNKQLEYESLDYIKKRATTFLWESNYHNARKLAGANPSLPRSLGGIDLAVGPQITFEDERFQTELLPYYLAIGLHEDDNVYFAFSALLQGIYMSEAKGIPYENSLKTVSEIVQNLETIRIKDLNELLPDPEDHVLWNGDKLRKIQKRGLVRLDWLVGEVSRRSAFESLWNPPLNVDGSRKKRPHVTLPIKEPFNRWKAVWIEIKRNFKPRFDPSIKTMKQLDLLFRDRSWNVWFNKEDPAIADAIGGVPSLFMDMKKDEPKLIGNKN